MFTLSIVAAGLGFLTHLLLARLLGVAAYGAYTYALSWLTLLAVPAMLGLDQLLIRNVAAYRVRSNWGLMHGLLRRANQTVLITSIGLVLLATTAAWLFGGRSDPQMLSAFLVAMISLPLVALTGLRQAAMRGLQRVVIGYLPEMLIRPLLFLSLIGGVYLFLGNGLGASWAVGLNVVTTAIAFLIGTRLLRQALPRTVTQAHPLYREREWMRSVLPLLFLGGMLVINNQIGVISLGTMKGAEATGIYGVVNRGTELMWYILVAANTALAPAIASMYAAGDIERLQRMVTKSTRLVLLSSLPLALGLMFFNYWFLLMFGEGFTSGGAALAILSFGYLVAAAMSSVDTLLIMTGHERDSAVVIGVSAMLNVILNVALIPGWGLEGAAVAMATSVVVRSLILTVLVYRRLGVHASALGRIG